MQEIILKNMKTAEYEDVNLNSLLDPLSAHQKSYEFMNSIVTNPNVTGEGKLKIAFYKLMPGKSNYPYHYHSSKEEVFYIISGTGTLKTPDGEKSVMEGDVIVFPANANGAHQLTNTSEEILIYIDIDTTSTAEVVFYPDKGDFRILTETATKSFSLNSEVNYMRNE